MNRADGPSQKNQKTLTLGYGAKKAKNRKNLTSGLFSTFTLKIDTLTALQYFHVFQCILSIVLNFSTILAQSGGMKKDNIDIKKNADTQSSFHRLFSAVHWSWVAEF